MTAKKIGVLFGLVAVLAGCQDLDTENLNAPDAERALSEPGDVEALIGSAWLTWYYGNQLYQPAFALSTAADEATASWGNFGMRQISSEPREAFPNSTGFSYRSVTQDPWYEMYGAISSVNDGLVAVANGMKFGTNGQDTDRAKAFAKFIQGLSHGWLALMFDKAFIFTEEDDLETTDFETQPYDVVMDAAITMLDQAAAASQSASFSIPENWIVGDANVNAARLARIAKSYSARFLAEVARTPAERAAVNWQDVIARANAGITQDFGPTLDNTRIRDRYKDYLSRYDWTRADLKTVGPADQSGGYQAWLNTPVADRMPFPITTPDRRVTGDTPTSDGSYFSYRATQNHPADRGTYHWSNYHSGRWLFVRQTQIGFAPIMTVTEMDLLKAEGYIRMGQPDMAVPLINKSRVANGQLPPVTASGVSGADCVPRTASGACGDLMDALMYEKKIEMFGVAAGTAFFDARGWGTLVEGTPIHFPIPARELETLNLPAYTFGGIGGPDAAPGCPLAC